jgi:DNA-binding CsgD family transcriptional regulator
MTQAVLSRVIGAIGADDFAAVTAGALCSFLGFDLTAVFAHRRAAEPLVLFDNFATAEARCGITNYVRFTHRVNPMLAAARAAGVCRARDFALNSVQAGAAASHLELTAEEELGFRTVGWPRRQEEICLYLESGAGLIELGFYRPRSRSEAPANKIRALQAIAAPVAAAFERHRALIGRDTPLQAAVLSAREREVCDLLLLGCSSAAIALRLNISRHTVKDHRKRIFRKLRIGSLAELFARLSRSH